MDFSRFINKPSRWYILDPNEGWGIGRHYYHTLDHIKEMFKLYEQKEQEFINESMRLKEPIHFDTLFWAIAYHDAIYMPGFAKNEELSAQVAEEELSNPSCSASNFLGLPADVAHLILTTKPSFEDHVSIEERILHDLDWAGFRAYDFMKENEKLIFNEAIAIGGYTAEQVKEGQLKFYKSLIGKDIYKTDVFRPYNQGAQVNILQRIAALEAE